MHTDNRLLDTTGANVYAVDIDGNVPYDYFGGEPDCINISRYIQYRRKVHQNLSSNEYSYFMQLINGRIDDEEAVFRTVQSFSSTTDDSLHYDTDHNSATAYYSVSSQIIQHIAIAT